MSTQNISGPTLPSTTTVDVVVIGAGLSGLRAALKIQSAGLSCAIVEAIDRVGGKTLSLPSKVNGPGVNDVGAAWINDTTQSEIFKLVQNYRLQSEVQMDQGLDVWEQAEGVVLSPHGVLPVRFLSKITAFILFYFSPHSLTRALAE